MKKQSLQNIGIAAILIIVVISIFSPLQNMTAKAQSKQVIEYKVVTIPGNISQSSLQTTLNEQGKLGWRYNNLNTLIGGNYLIFSRP
ncbi:hypothetical protein NIES4071_107690 (plasmid) [Calothrix sp. NIES-4071]|nr:hypothetical protein NIES4071_107690 [Calothrix sp. NIES-4071]BAZ64809.1 hypothetical protein NIES4105_105420 [Calothrix sp. NIES-4105]